MKRADLYSSAPPFDPIEQDGLTYSIDKIRLTFNLGASSGFETRLSNLVRFFEGYGYKSKKVQCAMLKWSLQDLAKSVHVQIWQEDPRGASTAKVRFEWNPNHTQWDYPPAFLPLVEQVTASRGCCPVVLNRVDYACDVPLPIEEILTLTRKHRADSFDDTLYFGRRGIEELKVYDKVSEARLTDCEHLTRLEWESYNDPLSFTVKEQFCRYTDDLPEIFRFLKPCKVPDYLSSLHHKTRSKYLKVLRSSLLPVSSAPFCRFSARFSDWLHSAGIDLTSELRSDVATDLLEISDLLKVPF